MIKKCLRILVGIVFLTNISLQADTAIAVANFNITAAAVSGQYIINQPGVYVLGADVKLPVGRSNVSMIHIAASNVVLDLNGKSLSLSTTNRMPCAKGISVGSSFKNIVIKNGFIIGSGANGAKIVDGISCQGAENVSIQNVIVQGCLQRGFYANSCKKFSISNASFDSTASSAANQLVHGFYASDCHGFILNDVSVSYNQSSRGIAKGMELSQCSNFLCEGVRAIRNLGAGNADNNQDNDEDASIGIHLASSHRNRFVSCTANDNRIITLDNNILDRFCYGFYLQTGSNNTLMQCEANGNSGGIGGAGIIVTNPTYNVFQSCVTNNNSAGSGGIAYGILCAMTNIGILMCSASVIGCSAYGSYVSGLGSKAYGIVFKGMKSGRIEGCFTGANTASSSYGIALISQPANNAPYACSHIDVANNTIFYNPGTSKAYGFYDDADAITSTLRGNTVYGHGVTYNAGADSPAGDEDFSNFYFNYANGQNLVDGIVEKNMLVQGYSVSDTDAWKNYSIN